jgi:hypothetical protein
MRMHVACCMLHVVMLHAARSCCVLRVARSCRMCCRVCPPWPAAEMESTASRMREPSSWKDLTSSCRSCRTAHLSTRTLSGGRTGRGMKRQSCTRASAAAVSASGCQRCDEAESGWNGERRRHTLDGTLGYSGYSWREAQAHLRRYASVDLDARDFLRTRKQLAVAAASALQLWQG